eukprot:TRINITY_DN32265_c0_g1_i4.p1 TRINITY_DN32265_c0_g1~~TRINITY_DN32265_c0_g1_i4.p1  ORF type:complete len:126 (-),score=23.15 TRINITY_DN32265_c0_g1_i4:453-830(-)
MVYLKTDADLIDVRALLHWEITHLPVFVVSQKNSTSVSGSKKQYKHKRWPLDGQSSPYDYDGAVAFVEKATGLEAEQVSAEEASQDMVLPKRGSPDWNKTRIGISWFLVVLVAIHCKLRGFPFFR